MKSTDRLSLFLMLFLLAGTWAYNAKKCDDTPTETGPCKGEFEMWRFDKINQQCESFIYGGCLATNNFFDSGMHCVVNCLKNHHFKI